jgi:hypothetical protein
MTLQFWSNQPTILFNKDYIFELWPTKDMCYEQKLNAITRLIILLTFLGYILTMKMKILGVGTITILIIFVLFTMRKQKITKEMMNEGFKNQISSDQAMIENASYVNPVTLDSVLKTEFKEGNRKNPFSNVLLTQINDDPERKAAPPSFNVSVDEDITKNVKKAIQMMNPDIKNTNNQLFGDIYQEFELDQSNRQFFSTANTRVTNDANAFGNFLYGNMPSAKENTPEGNIQRFSDAYRYTLY